VRTDRRAANSMIGNKSWRVSGSPPVRASTGTCISATSSIRWKASAVEKRVVSRGRFLTGRVLGAFHENSRVISQVTCDGRSLSPGGAAMAFDRPIADFAAPLWRNFARLAENCETDGIFTIVARTPFLSSAELHSNP
jgi:hypothetical protein